MIASRQPSLWRSFLLHFRAVPGPRDCTRPGVLNANRIEELEFFDEYFVCWQIVSYIGFGGESAVWNPGEGRFEILGADGKVVWDLGSEVREHALFLANTFSEAIEAVTLFDDEQRKTGRFELVFGAHRQDVLVDRSGDPTIVLRLPGASRLSEPAKASLSEITDNPRTLIFSGDDHRTRILGHDRLRFRERVAEILVWALNLTLLLLPVFLCCLLYARSPLRTEPGFMGWVLIVLVGFFLGMNLTQGFYRLFGPEEPQWMRQTPEDGVVGESERG